MLLDPYAPGLKHDYHYPCHCGCILFIQEKIMQGVALWGDDRETTKEGLRIAQIVPFILIWEEIGLLVLRTSDPTFWQNALLCAIILTYLIGILSGYRMIRNRIVQNQK